MAHATLTHLPGLLPASSVTVRQFLAFPHSARSSMSLSSISLVLSHITAHCTYCLHLLCSAVTRTHMPGGVCSVRSRTQPFVKHIVYRRFQEHMWPERRNKCSGDIQTGRTVISLDGLARRPWDPGLPAFGWFCSREFPRRGHVYAYWSTQGAHNCGRGRSSTVWLPRLSWGPVRRGYLGSCGAHSPCHELPWNTCMHGGPLWRRRGRFQFQGREVLGCLRRGPIIGGTANTTPNTIICPPSLHHLYSLHVAHRHLSSAPAQVLPHHLISASSSPHPIHPIIVLYIPHCRIACA